MLVLVVLAKVVKPGRLSGAMQASQHHRHSSIFCWQTHEYSILEHFSSHLCRELRKFLLSEEQQQSDLELLQDTPHSQVWLLIYGQRRLLFMYHINAQAHS